MSVPRQRVLSIYVQDDGQILERYSIDDHHGRDREHFERHISAEKAIELASRYIDAARVAMSKR